MNRSIIEIFVGFFVLAIAIGFLIFTYKISDVKKLDRTYQVKARFNQVDGVIIGSDVSVSGIKVGSVADLFLDPETYDAVMIIAIRDNVKLPVDSSARIVSDGLLGGKYVEVQAGADDRMLKNDDIIQYTQSSINLESLIGKFIFNSASSNDSKNQENNKNPQPSN
jgi:phospholipid/cholesterol/gamma-HCH transport system substrate-binding protein